MRWYVLTLALLAACSQPGQLQQPGEQDFAFIEIQLQG